MSSIEDVIAEIKKSRDYLDPENEREVTALEKTLEKLKTDRAFLELDYIKDIRKRIKSIILNVKIQLADEDDLEKRIRLKADRDAYIWLLGFVSRDVDKELEEINKRAREML